MIAFGLLAPEEIECFHTTIIVKLSREINV